MRADPLFVLGLLPLPSAAHERPFGMSYVKTKDLSSIYFDSSGYIVPHAVRTFTNSLEWQRRTFGWEPRNPPPYC